MKKLNVEKLVNKKGIEAIISNDTISKSEKMKNLFDGGYDIKTISTLMNVRYNFVYNVISNYVNMNGIELETVSKDNKKEKIIELYLDNKSNKDIAITLKTNYNYVFNVIKNYKLSLNNDENGIAK
jgi:transposase-like protein